VSRPRIGITSSIVRGTEPHDFRELTAYIAAIDAAGGQPIALFNDAAERETLGTLDGLLVSGGVDVDPGRYGEADRYPDDAYEHRSDRDTFEFAALAHARIRGLPTLCICRGMQAANVVFGGTLYQDLPRERGAAYASHEHREGGRSSYAIFPEHLVTIEPTSRLATIVGAGRLETNSRHHQAVCEVPAAFRVVGVCPDGTIEAIEATFAHPLFIGVQWHPERTVDVDPASRALFAALIAAARTLPV